MSNNPPSSSDRAAAARLKREQRERERLGLPARPRGRPRGDAAATEVAPPPRTPETPAGPPRAKAARPEPATPPGTRLPPLPDVDESDPAAVVRATVLPLRTLIHRVANTPDSNPREVSTLVTALAGVTKLLARLEGDFELTESILLRSRVYAPTRDAIFDALEAFPEARRAVLAALEKLTSS